MSARSLPPKSLSAKQRAFLAAFPIVGTITGAAEAAGCNRRMHVDWMADPEYSEAFNAARESLVESLESEAIRRARDGTIEGVYQGGIQVGEQRKYSDTLTIFLLKANRPEKYRDEIRVISESEIDAELRRLTNALGVGHSGVETQPVS